MTTYETFSTETRTLRGRTILAIFGVIAAAAANRIRAWKNRRDVARLLHWDQHMLSDIGLTQGDVYCAMAARVDEDPSVQLSMFALERRFAHEAQMRDRLEQAAELRARARR